MRKILIVEDDENLADIMRNCLEANQFRVELASDGEDGLVLARSGAFDLIILDWNLPRKEGIDVCQALRFGGSDVPILMVTGLDSLKHKVEGLERGADDYMTKPFHVREMLARVRALLRRGERHDNPDEIRSGDLTLNRKTCEVRRLETPITLSRTEFMMLELFLENPGQVFSPDAIILRVWNSDAETTHSTVRTFVKQLRQKIGDLNQEVIETVHGMGYRLKKH